MTPASSVERSFIFADLSGFTAMTELHGDEDAAGVALRFAELARASLADGARLVKTIGDAVMLVVPTPELAVKTALELRSAVEREPRFPLLRTGIHHGPCAERDGDHFGAAVNLAARVAGHARAGQLLVTAAVAAAARRRRPQPDDHPDFAAGSWTGSGNGGLVNLTVQLQKQ